MVDGAQDALWTAYEAEAMVLFSSQVWMASRDECIPMGFEGKGLMDVLSACRGVQCYCLQVSVVRRPARELVGIVRFIRFLHQLFWKPTEQIVRVLMRGLYVPGRVEG